MRKEQQRSASARSQQHASMPGKRRTLPTQPPRLLIDETPQADGAMGLSVGLDEDGRPACVVVHGVRASAMRKAMLKLAAEHGDAEARRELRTIDDAEARDAEDAEAEQRRLRALRALR